MQISENPRRSLLENSYKLCRSFHQAMKALITCFVFFIKLLFSVLTKIKTVRSAYSYLNFFFFSVQQQQQLYFVKYLHDNVYSKLFVPANSRARQGWDKFKITNIQFKLVESIRQIISYRLVKEENQISRENNSLKIQKD